MYALVGDLISSHSTVLHIIPLRLYAYLNLTTGVPIAVREVGLRKVSFIAVSTNPYKSESVVPWPEQLFKNAYVMVYLFIEELHVRIARIHC